MERVWGLWCVCVGFGVFQLCNGLPVEILSASNGSNAQLISVLVAVMVSVCVVFTLLGCVCCQRRKGFQEFRNSPATAAGSVINETSLNGGDDPGHVNPIANSEFTIFTPLSPPHHNNNVFRTHQSVTSYNENEIQPESISKFENAIVDGIDTSSWFDGSEINFPRTKLKYIRELGSGWFGRVVEGEAQDILEDQPNKWIPVAVRILDSTASAREQAIFLHEAEIYRLSEPHPNVLKLLGRSLEATPLLLIQEFSPKGDLKKFLLENRNSSNNPMMLGVPLQFCCQLASALQYLHDNNLPHLDLAARNCQVTAETSLKLGDYGVAVSSYPNDYYQGTPAVPVRWCAPETLNYTNTTLQPKQVTCEGNIWSFGVTMWEICEWGSQPYNWLTDDEVVSQVMGMPHVRLSQPNLTVYYIQPLYRLMQLCWQSTENRPQISQVHSMLLHLFQTYQQQNVSQSPSKLPEYSAADFDSRWETFKPNTIVKTDNHMEAEKLITDVSSVSSVIDIFTNSDPKKSASLTNLHGSFENLVENETAEEVETPQNMDSWLQNVASHTGDMQYVRGLSQAIQALDSALASEQTSSSDTSCDEQQKIEFKLGGLNSSGTIPPTKMDESSEMMDSILFARRSESGSETEDETWKRRIERGAYSEKVRQKSKSVADLMVLTHIDCSDTDSETPLQSLEYRVNYKNVRCTMKNNLENASLVFGSEGNLLTVQDTFQEELKKLQEERRDSLLFVPAREPTYIISATNQCDTNQSLINTNLLDLVETQLSNVHKFDDPIGMKIGDNVMQTFLDEERQHCDNNNLIKIDKNQSTILDNKSTENVNAKELNKFVTDELSTSDKNAEIQPRQNKQDESNEELQISHQNKTQAILLPEYKENKNLEMEEQPEVHKTINEEVYVIDKKEINLTAENTDKETDSSVFDLETEQNKSNETNLKIESINPVLELEMTNQELHNQNIENTPKEILNENVQISFDNTFSCNDNFSFNPIKDNKEMKNDELQIPLSTESQDNLIEKETIEVKIIVPDENNTKISEQKQETEIETNESVGKVAKAGLESDQLETSNKKKIDQTEIKENLNVDNKNNTKATENIVLEQKQIVHQETENKTNEKSGLKSDQLEASNKEKIDRTEMKENLTVDNKNNTKAIENIVSKQQQIVHQETENKTNESMEKVVEASLESGSKSDQLEISNKEKIDRTEMKENLTVDNKNNTKAIENIVSEQKQIVHQETENKTNESIEKLAAEASVESDSKSDQLETSNKEKIDQTDIKENLTVDIELIPFLNETVQSPNKKSENKIFLPENEPKDLNLLSTHEENEQKSPESLNNLLEFFENKPTNSLLDNKNMENNLFEIKSNPVMDKTMPIYEIKKEDFSTIQNFINNERYFIDTANEKLTETADEKRNNPETITANLLDLDSLNDLQKINTVYNVFNVTVDHNLPIECFTNSVQTYFAPKSFEQNDLIADINGLLLESEREKFTSDIKSLHVNTNLFNSLNKPLANGLTARLIETFANEDVKSVNNPKKLSDIVLDSLETSVNYETELLKQNGDELFNSSQRLPIEEDIKNNSIIENGSNIEETQIINGENINKIEELLRVEEATENIEELFNSSQRLPVKDDIKNNSIKENASNIGETLLKDTNCIKSVTKENNEIISNNDDKNLIQSDTEQLEINNVTENSLEQNELQENVAKLSKQISDKDNEESIHSSIEDLPDLIVDTLESCTSEESTIEIEQLQTNSIHTPKKLSEIVLDTLKSTPEFSDKNISDTLVQSSESKNRISDKRDLSVDNLLDISYLPDNSCVSSTPFVKKTKLPKKTDEFISFVSEGDEPTVILGPCEDYTLGLYSGLKTTFEKYWDDGRPEEELLQFSSNFMPFAGDENINTTMNEQDKNSSSVDYSLETWDRFLGKSLQDQDVTFENLSPRHDVFDDKTKILEPNKTFEIPKKPELDKNSETFIVDEKLPESESNNKTFILNEDKKEDLTNDKETDATILNSWEPGEGWFLHPQDPPESLSGDIDISGSENIDNSYVGFTLDEECVNALRNELAAKLPHAQGISHEVQEESDEWNPEDRNEIIVKYNVYATPLSPIPEESCCDDVYCEKSQHRDGSDSESDWSEPCMARNSQAEDILAIDTETHSALILESPSSRDAQHRQTPSQDSCCSNDTLFNLDDLNYAPVSNEQSPHHHQISTASNDDHDEILQIEISETEDELTPKLCESVTPDTDANLTYTVKPDINIDLTNEDPISESQSLGEDVLPKSPTKKLELKLEPNAFGVAPLPSPEDIPWRQLPASLLTYNEVVQNDNKFDRQDDEDDRMPDESESLNLNQDSMKNGDDLSDSVRECTLNNDLYSNLTDIRFSGPCDTQLMSTSFSESADYVDERDWDSGSDTRSSSSGEFIWKEGEHEESLRALHAASHDVGVTEDLNPMDAIQEENSNSSDDDSDDDIDEDIEETEFVPSAWNSQATPTKSALKSPEKSNERKNQQQKGVSFKKQKYHCVYEYPREPESPVAPTPDLWRSGTDFANCTDWELDPDACVPSFEDQSMSDYRDGYDSVLDKYISRSNYPLTSATTRHRDLYQLNPFPDFATGISSADEDFFISSSARPFQSLAGQSSQFFPGQKTRSLWPDFHHTNNLSDNITPDSGVEDVTPASLSGENPPLTEQPILQAPPRHKVQTLKYLAAIAANKIAPSQVSDTLGGLRHTRNRLKLDLPPSPNSFTSNRTFTIDTNCDSVNRETPTFTTFGKSRFSVQHVATPTDTDDSDSLTGKTGKSKNVSFEALPHQPAARFGGNHGVYILNKTVADDDDGKMKHKPVEIVQGEASLLDSADEDSGIESSANATLERHQQQQQILNN